MQKGIFVSGLLIFGLLCSVARAEDLREVELFDGSLIYAEMLSFEDGVYTLKSESLGTIRIDESNIQSIHHAGVVKAGITAEDLANVSTGELIKAIKERLIGENDTGGAMLSFLRDPDLQEIINDPDIMKAIEAGNIQAVITNPKCMKLMSKPAVKDFIGKMIGEGIGSKPGTE